MVKIKLEAASVCGTDLHIYKWDPWAASRIKPPRIIGHEFCGTIVEVGDGVASSRIGEFVSSESHIACWKCRACLDGKAHACSNTTILGVDIDGGFAPYVVIPEQNARLTSREIPPRLACFQDALGNAVHTVTSGPVLGRDILITGMGPIGLFAATVCKALGAKQVIATEVSPYRIDLAEKVGVDSILNPLDGPVLPKVLERCPEGVDACLEMSGHPSSLDLAVNAVRPGGRISCLGVYGESPLPVPMNEVIFKGLDIHGIVGRKLWETWHEMSELHASKKLRLDPVITHEMHYTEFQKAMEMMSAGKAGKVVFTFE